MTFGSLFAGIGGMDLGLERAGMRCVWQVEIDPFCRRVLAKHWPDVRRWDDVRTFPPKGDWSCDLIAGGFPCQDISIAGRGAGIAEGTRSGLWSEYARIVRVLRPRYVLVENVAALLVRGMDRVLGDLAELGFDAEWSVLPACVLGAPHARERVFIVAHRNEIGCRRWRDRMPDATRSSHWQATEGKRKWEDVERWIRSAFSYCDRPADPSSFQRVADGIPERVERVGGLGNAVVPQVAEWIGRRLMQANQTEDTA